MSKSSSAPASAALMRLVIEYTDSDGCTYSCTMTKPVLYASAEAFAVDFEAWCRANKAVCSFDLKFAGQGFSPSSFFHEGVYYGPDVLTVDEWFAKAEKG
jgi:hypothetical protein